MAKVQIVIKPVIVVKPVIRTTLNLDIVTKIFERLVNLIRRNHA